MNVAANAILVAALDGAAALAAEVRN